MHNLEQAIENWRNELLAQEALLAENIEELEDHLRTSLSHLVNQGLSEEEAFFIATKRMGTSTNLNAEYGKINLAVLWIQRLRWMILGVLVFYALNRFWILFAKVTSESLLFYSNSPISSGILYVALSAILPIVVWIGLSSIAHTNSVLLNHLTTFFRFISKRPRRWASFLVGLFLVFPVAEIISAGIVTRLISPQMIGEYSRVAAWYGLISKLSLPIFGTLILLWLGRSRNKYSTTK